MAKKQQPEENSLENFSRVVKDIFAEKRIREDEFVEKAKTDLPYQIESLPSLTNEFLVEWFDTCLNGAFSNPRLMEVLAELKEAIKNEILKRMEK
ncbi:hypothetical protein P9VFCI_155 [Rhizobium phage P9VFCI]|uniref:Uncharacterized protein n=1 Tax=Rhizobium phage P9VFCI TaxID=2763531 RepID=A0A7G7WXK0_9CAUD|nr:hypothetical protein PP937_gp155 [Rhizobium phage P9VFCI]QNH71944.1 hypothetical protein P9VFCI_155 [Rhizobium phage P9VFCI]